MARAQVGKLPCQTYLTADQLEAIGCVAVEAAELDLFIEAMIWRLCEMDEQTGRIFTDSPQLSAKLSILADLTKLRIQTKELLEEFELINGNLSNAITDRNTVLHGQWIPGAFGAPATAQRIKRKQANIPKIQADQTMSKALNISTSHRALRSFFRLNWTRLSLPNTPPQLPKVQANTRVS